jgi:hypothetical protein
MALFALAVPIAVEKLEMSRLLSWNTGRIPNPSLDSSFASSGVTVLVRA